MTPELEKHLQRLLAAEPNKAIRQQIESAFRGGAGKAAGPGDVGNPQAHAAVTMRRGGRVVVAEHSCGWMNHPDHTARPRNEYAQTKMSGGTGDHAAHRLPNQTGGAGGAENMSRFNGRMNTGEILHNVENRLADKIRAGSRVFLAVKDVTARMGVRHLKGAAAGTFATRPIGRKYDVIEVAPDGKVTSHPPKVVYGNFSSPERRAATEVPDNVRNIVSAARGKLKSAGPAVTEAAGKLGWRARRSLEAAQTSWAALKSNATPQELKQRIVLPPKPPPVAPTRQAPAAKPNVSTAAKPAPAGSPRDVIRAALAGKQIVRAPGLAVKPAAGAVGSVFRAVLGVFRRLTPG